MNILNLRLLKSKNGNGLELSYEKPGAQNDKIVVTGETHTALIHGDFYNAIQALVPHLAAMAFHQNADEEKSQKEFLSDFSVGSFHIRGRDEKRGIVISGTLRKDGRAHNFNTPFYRFDEEDGKRYHDMDKVEELLEAIDAELPAYLNGTKRGEPIQPELPLADGKVTSMKIDEGDTYAKADAMGRVAEMPNGTSKGNGRKRVAQSAAAPGGIVEEAQ